MLMFPTRKWHSMGRLHPTEMPRGLHAGVSPLGCSEIAQKCLAL